MGFLTDDPASTAPQAAETAKNRGNDHLARGELDLAAACYQEAVRLLPTYAEAYVNLGYVHKERKQYAQAERLFLRAAALKPSLWQAHYYLGMLSEESDCPDAAVSHYQRALDSSPPVAESRHRLDIQWRLANALVAQARYADALPLMEEVVASNPGSLDARCNIGTILNKLGRHAEALSWYERVVAECPQHAVANHFLGIVHQELNHWEEAREHYRRTRVLAPDYFDAQRDEAYLSLLLGDYENGWPQHEAMLPGLHVKGYQEDQKAETEALLFRRAFMPGKYWAGDDLGGRSLLVWTEQGLGDSLMMLRYIPLIKARGAGKIIVHCEQALARLIREIPEVDEVIPKTGKVDGLRFDRHCSAMSLPFLLGTRLDTIPNHVPYVSVAKDARAKWADRLTKLPAFAVGLAWGGNRKLPRDRQRSIPLQKLEPLFNVAGVTWISLQKGEPAEQLKEADWPIIDWMDECQDLYDTAALVENLDLVVSVDTSVVHLAGALGRPTWLLNRYGSEWRWLLDREDSPWYPSVRIFRQPAKGDWDSVIRRVAGELGTLVGA